MMFSAPLGDLICQALSEGKTLREVCRLYGLAPSTVLSWRDGDVGPGFAEQYTRARQLGYEAQAEELEDIAAGRAPVMAVDENGNEYPLPRDVQRDRLRFDSRRWLLSKALPKVYGDRLAVEASGPGGGPIPLAVGLTDDELARVAGQALTKPSKS